MSRSAERPTVVQFRRVSWGAAAWIGILIAIGIVQLIRVQWFDAAVFLAVAVLLIADAVRPARIRPARRGAVRVAVIGLIAAGVVAASLPRHSLWMQILVCVTGLSVLLFAWPQHAERGSVWPRGLRRLAWAWALILIAGCLWELGEFIVGLVHPDRPAFALSDLIDPFLSGWPGRSLFAAIWILGGLFLVTRGRR